MKKLRFEITITLAEGSAISADDLAANLSDAVGSFADENAEIDDFDIIEIQRLQQQS